eukprot:m.20419 g.20419  ORF g.20419 m.20419 type:complete len:925 (+) comp28015_c0_seq2:188-2962(+)
MNTNSIPLPVRVVEFSWNQTDPSEEKQKERASPAKRGRKPGSRGRKRSLLVREAVEVFHAVSAHANPNLTQKQEAAQTPTTPAPDQPKRREGRGIWKQQHLINDPTREVFECEECGKKYYSMPGLAYHMRTKHTQEEAEEEKNEENTAVDVPATGSGRRAAQRAMKRFTKILVKKDNSKDDDSSDGDDDGSCKSDCSSRPSSIFAPSPSEMDAVAVDESPQSVSLCSMSSEEEIVAPRVSSPDILPAVSPSPHAQLSPVQPPEPQSSPSVRVQPKYWKDVFTPEQVEVLLKQNKKRCRKRLVCPKEGCDTTFTSFGGVAYHYERCGITFECPLCKKPFTTETLMNRHKRNCGSRKPKGEKKGEMRTQLETDVDFFNGPVVHLPSRQKGRRAGVRWLLMGADSRTKQWARASRKELLPKNSFVLAFLMPKPEHWRALTAQEQLEYLPASESPTFSFSKAKNKEKTQIFVKDQKIPSSFKLNLFESTHIAKAGWIANSGGPVWATDWCPLPESVDLKSEYFAVSTHSSMSETHVVGKTFDRPGLIQIWEFNKETSKMTFVFGIAHNWGAVWDIKWCPSGAWQSAEKSPAEQFWRRLGIVAVACSSGRVYVLSIPHPSELGVLTEENRIFSVTPSLFLAFESVDSMHGQAWCLTWERQNSHRRLAAGFSDGSIAVWDLETDVNWLRDTSNDTLVRPMLHFLAHTSVVRSLEWCPLDSNFIVSAAHGRDAHLRVWDLRDVHCPLYDLGTFAGFVQEIQWLPYWNALVCGGEMLSRSVLHHLHLISLSQRDGDLAYPLKGRLAQSSSPFMSLSYSDWTNAIAFSSADGTVGINILPAVSEQNLVKTEGYWELYKVTKNEGDGGLVFIDNKTECDQSLMSQAEPTSWITQPDYSSVTNKVRFCPNFHSSNLLLSCGTSGLVRLIEISRLN